jgi:hypothetical protein
MVTLLAISVLCIAVALWSLMSEARRRQRMEKMERLIARRPLNC